MSSAVAAAAAGWSIGLPNNETGLFLNLDNLVGVTDSAGFGKYQFETLLYQTGTAQILKCLDIRTNTSVAIKVARRDLSALAAQEYGTLARLQGCERIVQLVDVFEYLGHVCVVLELVGTCLHDVSRNFKGTCGLSFDAFRRISKELLLALDSVHAQGTIHADVKPGNVCLNSSGSTVKLIDFGNAMDLCNVSLYFDRFEVQTTRYRAPEVVFGVKIGAEIDIWSTALTLLELYIGQPLFTANNPLELVEQWADFFGWFDCKPFMEGKYADRLPWGNQNDAKLRHPPRRSLSEAPGRANKSIIPNYEGDTISTGGSTGGLRRRSFPASWVTFNGTNTVSIAGMGLAMESENLNPNRSKTGLLSSQKEESRERNVIRERIKLLSLNHGGGLARTDSALDLFARMLSFDPLHRIKASEALQHDFFACLNEK